MSFHNLFEKKKTQNYNNKQTHLKQGLVPIEQRDDMIRLNRNQKSPMQSSNKFKNLLLGQNLENTDYHKDNSVDPPKGTKKHFSNSQIPGLDPEFWKDMQSNLMWKNEIEQRSQEKYGSHCIPQ